MMVDPGNQSPAYVYPLCTALAAEGCVVELVTAPFVYGDLPRPRFPLRYAFGRVARLPWLKGAQRLRQVLRGVEYPLDWAVALIRIALVHPTVVHVQWAMVPPVDAIAFRIIRWLGPRLVLTVHDTQPRYGRLRRTLLALRPLYALADQLIVHTLASQAVLCKTERVPSARVHVVPHGSMVEWSAAPPAREHARQILDLPVAAPLVLFFGVIKPYKRLDRLLLAVPEVLARLPDTRLVIAGRPEGSFVPYERLVQRLNLGERVIARPGYVAEADVPRYFAAADVVVLPYQEADASGVLLHAYTFGRPVVVANAGGLAELVDDGVTGLVVAADDPRALADAILALLTDPERAARLGRQARERAGHAHDWRASARATLRVYASATSAR
jgi:glycosyltransferase involved in cell wall biosynthesis